VKTRPTLSDFKVYPPLFLWKKIINMQFLIINMQFFFKLRSYHDKEQTKKTKSSTLE
jgi:hypothetical protein